jgi:hypothetical protein
MPARHLIHHVGVFASDFAASEFFYTSALEALGIEAAAVVAGGTSRHEPRYWPEYRAHSALVSDPDGNNVEALVKEAEAS